MDSRSLLMDLQNQLDAMSQLSESNILCKVTSDDQKTAKAVVSVPCEGKVKLFEIKAVEIGVYEGLAAT